MSGLVMLLPHGYEGQGPEHSSARLERFLQLCAEDNIQVVQPDDAGAVLPRAAPADAPHFRKPLIVMSPRACSATAGRLAARRLRRRRLPARARRPRPPEPERGPPRAALLRQDLLRASTRAGRSGTRDAIAIVRVEQLYPFPRHGAHRRAPPRIRAPREFAWVQEEPQNMGAWSFVGARLEALLRGRRLRYVGRDEAASPATG